MSFVQGAIGADGAPGGGTTVTCTFASGLTANNWVVWYATLGNGFSITSVADNASSPNTYSPALQLNNTNSDGQDFAFGAAKVVTGGGTILTITASGIPGFYRIGAAEYSLVPGGVDVSKIGAFQTAVATTADLITSGNAITTVNGDTIVGVCVNTNSSHVANQGTNFTKRATASGGSGESTPLFLEDRVQATASASTPATFTATTSGGNWIAGMVALSPAAASSCRGLMTMGVGCMISLAGLRMPLLIGGAACRVGQHIRRNATLSRRQFLSLPQERQKS